MRETIQEYYGHVLQTSGDLRTDACATVTDTPEHVRNAIAGVHPDVAARYYGCGLVIPDLLTGARVLDLGCGAGRDVYVIAQLVGPKGAVVGVDMTPQQLAVARAHEAWHADRFGYDAPNTGFLDGLIEGLGALDLEPASFDVIVSNCVLNLAEDKEAVLAGAHRLLKPGGEMYFADVYADRRLPDALRADPVLVGECMGGALYWNDFLSIARRAGFADPRLVEDRPIDVVDPVLSAKVAPASFYSATYRLMKLDGLDDACEDYGQAVRYRGGIVGSDTALRFDKHHMIARDRVFPVCRNTYRMLSESRFAAHFEFFGDDTTHFGLFEGCGEAMPFDAERVRAAATASSGCC